MPKPMARHRRTVSVDGPGDCNCCSVEATTSTPVYIADLVDPEDGAHYARLCGLCLTDVEAAVAAADQRAAA